MNDLGSCRDVPGPNGTRHTPSEPTQSYWDVGSKVYNRRSGSLLADLTSFVSLCLQGTKIGTVNYSSRVTFCQNFVDLFAQDTLFSRLRSKTGNRSSINRRFNVG